MLGSGEAESEFQRVALKERRGTPDCLNGVFVAALVIVGRKGRLLGMPVAVRKHASNRQSLAILLRAVPIGQPILCKDRINLSGDIRKALVLVMRASFLTREV